MGKIRVKTFDETEQAEKDAKLAAKREQKKREKEAAKASQTEQKAGTVAPIAQEEEKAAVAVDTIAHDIENATEAGVIEEKEAKKKESKYAAKLAKDQSASGRKGAHKSKRYQETVSMVDKKKTYKLPDAVELLKKFKKAKFDETVEIHLNVREKGLNGQVILPHGTGKTRRIKIVDDATIANIEKGIIDFDVLVAQPQMMPKLARVARILGPRGLMPNPKAGTVTDKVDEVVEKLSGGQVNYKTESAAPIIHLSIGKASFDNDKIVENVKSVISSVGAGKVESATIKLTMSPGVKIDTAKL